MLQGAVGGEAAKGVIPGGAAEGGRKEEEREAGTLEPVALSSFASSSRSASAMRRWRSAALRSSCTPCSALVARRPVQHPPGLQLHLQARVLSTSAAAEAEAEAEGERRAGQQPAGERRAASGQGGAVRRNIKKKSVAKFVLPDVKV